MPDARILSFVLIGIGLVCVVALRKSLERLPLSLPIIYVAVGYGVFALPLGFPVIDPLYNEMAAQLTEYLTEFIVIVSLLSAGIAIDRPLSFQRWRQVLPLLVVLMPLSIAAVAVFGWWWLGLTPAAAVLLGGSLAPTDPVLARTVQVGPPGENARHDVRFNLTVEAGLNDGLAFPFIHLALALAAGGAMGSLLTNWVLEDVLWRIGMGSVVGYVVGRAGAWFVFRGSDEHERHREEKPRDRIETSEGIIVLGTLLCAYGLAEVVHGYGFLAVFIGAVTARQIERNSGYHRLSHHFIDQIEEIVLVIMLFGFGGLLASGILSGLTLKGAALGLALLFIVRPLLGALSQIGSTLPWSGRWAVAFLGIRGMGSLYYLAYGRTHGSFAEMDQLFAIVSFTILVSIILHGTTATAIMRQVEAERAHVLPGEDDHVGNETMFPDESKPAKA